MYFYRCKHRKAKKSQSTFWIYINIDRRSGDELPKLEKTLGA